MNIFEVRKELRYLCNKTTQLQLEIDSAEKRCNHEWSYNNYKEEQFTGCYGLSWPTTLSNGTTIWSEPIKEIEHITVYTRTCCKCGKHEETKNLRPTVWLPDWEE